MAIVVAACGDPPFSQPVTFHEGAVEPAVLNEGWRVYRRYCLTCHGATGAGDGPAARGMQPAPRDFRLAVFKFAAVPAGQLPRDADLARTIREGLHGTPMRGLDLTDRQVDAVIQYLKTLPDPAANRWMRRAPGQALETSPDPWRPEERAAAIARGRRLYHVDAQCASCHPYYVSQPELDEIVEAKYQEDSAGGAEAFRAPSEMRADARLPRVTESPELGRVLAPDFTFHPLKAGDSPEDVYRTVAAGIGGTAMPRWKGALPERDLWAIVHYVRSLAGAPGS